MKQITRKFTILAISFSALGCANYSEIQAERCLVDVAVERAEVEIARQYPDRSYLARDGRFEILETAEGFDITFVGNNPVTGNVEYSPVASFSSEDCRLISVLKWQ